ncbi:MAG: SRPBCC domain-containing protein [Bacteroidota bacterium]
MLDKINVSRTYAQPVEQVWRAITDSDALASWFLPNDFEAKVGHEFTFKDKPAPGFDGIIRGQVLTVETPHRLAYSWRGGSLDSEVEFVLSPTATGGTRLDLEHRGFAGLANKLIVRNLLAIGWRKRLLSIKLPQYLTTHA